MNKVIMNKENIRELINALKVSETYDQSVYTHYHDCESPACIAGHAVALSGELIDALDYGTIDECAANWMGISRWVAAGIFDSKPLKSRPTREDAVAMLEHFLETGGVDWERLSYNTTQME